MSADNLPPGVTDADISGDRRLKTYTVEMRVRIKVEARDEDDAIEQSESNLGEAEILRADIEDVS